MVNQLTQCQRCDLEHISKTFFTMFDGLGYIFD